MNRDEKLNILVRRLSENLAGDLERIALFGSRARDDWRPDSDYDLLIVLRESTPPFKDRVYSVVTDFELEHDYDLFSPIDKGDTEKALEEAKKFVEQARRYVESQGITLEP